MKNRVIPNVDLDEMLDDAQVEAERYWDKAVEWHPLGWTADEASPMSFPIRE